MTYDDFNAFCDALPSTTHVVQWGGAHVWKGGGKIFAIGGWETDRPAFTFKVGDVAFEVMSERKGCRPAPYLASRGLKWIQSYGPEGLNDDELRDYLRNSHRIVALGLPKKIRATVRTFD